MRTTGQKHVGTEEETVDLSCNINISLKKIYDLYPFGCLAAEKNGCGKRVVAAQKIIIRTTDVNLFLVHLKAVLMHQLSN